MMLVPIMEVDLRVERHLLLFEEVWSEIPYWDQDIIRERVALISDCNIPNQFTRFDHWRGIAGVDMAKRLSYSGNTYQVPAMVIYLQEKHLTECSDEAVKGIIAHELGHGFNGRALARFPIFYFGIAAYYQGGDFSNDWLSEEELRADEKAREWGFESPMGAKRRELIVSFAKHTLGLELDLWDCSPETSYHADQVAKVIRLRYSTLTGQLERN